MLEPSPVKEQSPSQTAARETSQGTKMFLFKTKFFQILKLQIKGEA